MSVEAITWASKQRTGSAGAKLVLIALANYANERHECWPSQATLAEWTEQSDRTIRTHLAALEGMGLIERQTRHVPGAYTSDRIILQVDQRQLFPAENSSVGKKRPFPAENFATNPSIEPSSNIYTPLPPKEAKTPKRPAAATKVAMTPDWLPAELPDNVRALTDQWPDGRLAREIDQFRDYWIDRTDKRAGWDRTFHNRIRDIHDRVMRETRSGFSSNRNHATGSSRDGAFRAAERLYRQSGPDDASCAAGRYDAGCSGPDGELKPARITAMR